MRGRAAPLVHEGEITRRVVQPLGTGVLPIAAILAEVRSHGFAGNISIEYEANPKDPSPDMKKCVEYVRAIAKKVA